VARLVPGLERQPVKKLNADADGLLMLLHRWRNEAEQSGHVIKRIVVAYEAGRDGFWLARWLEARAIEACVIHPSSVAVSREHRRAKTDRLDTELLMRAFLGWLRGEKRHCSMAAIPTVNEEDARRSNRERDSLVRERTRIVNRIKAILARFGIRSPGVRTRREKESQIDLTANAPYKRASGLWWSSSAFESPAAVAGLDDVAVVSEAIEERGGHLGVTEHRRMVQSATGSYLMSR
jgi:transposase